MLNFCEILQFKWTFSTAVFGTRRTFVRLTSRRTTLLAQICLSPKEAVSNFEFETASHFFATTDLIKDTKFCLC